MTLARGIVLVLGLGIALAAPGSSGTAGQVGNRGLQAAPPRFADPDRAARLRAAFPEVDRLFEDFAARVPAPALPTES